MKKIYLALLALMGVNQHLSADQRQDVASASAQVAPGAVASYATHAWGLTPANLVAYISVLFLVLQVAHLIWKWRRQSKIDATRALHGLPPAPTDWGKL